MSRDESPSGDSASYVVGPGSLASFVGVVLIAFSIGITVAISVLEPESSQEALWVFSPFFLFGVVVLWSSSRRAVVSDAGITFRSLFGSTFVPWSEIGHVRHSDSWVVIKDRDGHSHRIGPNPYKADAF